MSVMCEMLVEAKRLRGLCHPQDVETARGVGSCWTCQVGAVVPSQRCWHSGEGVAALASVKGVQGREGTHTEGL